MVDNAADTMVRLPRIGVSLRKDANMRKKSVYPRSEVSNQRYTRRVANTIVLLRGSIIPSLWRANQARYNESYTRAFVESILQYL